MTDKTLAIVVVYKRYLTGVTPQRVPASLTLDKGRVASAIEKENGLLFAVKRMGQNLFQESGEGSPGFSKGGFLPHIHDVNARKRNLIDPGRKRKERIALLESPIVTFNGWGGAPQDDRRIGQLPTADGHFSSVVSR